MENRPRPRRSLGGRLFRGFMLLLLAWIVLTVPPVLLLRWANPPTSAFMLRDRLAAPAGKGKPYRIQYLWVEFKRISPDAGIAVIASEDQLFAVHRGFDLQSIRKAADGNSRGKRIRGASTISQQVAKNLFLWNGRSYLRKGIEAWLTMLIELTWSKRRILEVYLNIAQFGRGIYGVEAASRAFYREPASRLSAAQAATLAAVLPNPLRMHADRPSRYVSMRRNQILTQMRALGGRAYLKQLNEAQHAR
jgi:monofunctional biosynthetic peptidoglycan transglycosylase